MKRKNFIFILLPYAFLFLFLWQGTLEAKLLVITHAYKRPDFIALQEKTFRAFLKDDYEFVVFNDATDRDIFLLIQETCAKFNLRCIPIPQEIHASPYLPRVPGEAYDHPVIKCANVVQYSLDRIGFDHDGLVMIIDSDMFLVNDLNVAEHMQGCDISGLPQSRGHVEYIWNGIVFFNMQTMPAKKEISFNSGMIEGQSCDVGGETYYYFRNHPEVRLEFIKNHMYVASHMHEEKSKFHPFVQLMMEENVPNCEFFMNYTLFHYRGGGNWDYKSNEYHQHKTAVLHQLISMALESVQNPGSNSNSILEVK
jgi:hypothetical protein